MGTKIILTDEAKQKLKDCPEKLLEELIIAVCQYPGIWYYLNRAGLVTAVEET